MIVAVAAAAAAGAGVAGYFYVHRTPTLTDKDTIVLADFKNTTGDEVFDDTLRQGLSVQLEQSPFLSLVSDERIRKTLGLMGRPPDARLTPDVARDVCERTGSAAVLEGSIAPLGTQYVLGLRARNCRTGDVLDEEQAQAARKEDVLNALSQIAKTFRTRVGESLATVKEHSTPLEEATTPSLEALKAYSAASKVNATEGDVSALPLFKRAAELDPQFAIAFANLGLASSAIGEAALSAESTRRGYELRNRTSDPERFFIATMYDRQVTGNLERELQTLTLWAQTYPRDSTRTGCWRGSPRMEPDGTSCASRRRRRRRRSTRRSSFRYDICHVQPVPRAARSGRARLAAGRDSPFAVAEPVRISPRVPERRPRRHGSPGGGGPQPPAVKKSWRTWRRSSSRGRVACRPRRRCRAVPSKSPSMRDTGSRRDVRSGARRLECVLRKCAGGPAARRRSARSCRGAATRSMPPRWRWRLRAT